MDDSAPRTLIYPVPFGDTTANYDLPANTTLRPEIITARTTVEPPLIVYALVTYTDPFADTFAQMMTIPSYVNPAVVSTAVAFTFGITLTTAPSSVLRTTVVPGATSIFDTLTFTAGLPDTVLTQNQSIGIQVVATKPDGTGGTISINQAVIWAEVVDTSTVTDVVPPYTSIAYADQTGAVAV